MLNLDAAADETRARILSARHSRLPVHAAAGEEMLGVVQAKDLLDACLRGEPPDVRGHLRQAPVIPDTADALQAVALIKNSAVHLALVHDEYGHFEGIVTNADILQAIVGAARTEAGPPEPDAVQRRDGSWLISGSMPADEMAERLGIDLPADRDYHTAAGFVLSCLGQLPTVGESFEAFGWRFEVIDIDGRRVDKVLARLAGRRRAALRR